MRVTKTPVDIRLDAIGRRVESRDMDRTTGAGHGLPVAGMAVAAAGIISFWTGAGVATALAAHLLLEAGGRLDVAPWAPFSSRRWHGRRLWDERGWRPNLCASMLAGAVLVALLLAGR